MRILPFGVLAACAFGCPAADYTTYIGDAYEYHVTAIATDASGNTFVTGSRVIAQSSLGAVLNDINDVFVSKVDPMGNVTLITTLSGKGSDQANGIALDPAGNICGCGR